MLETQTLLQSYSKGIELCHGPFEVTSGEPEVPGKPEVSLAHKRPKVALFKTQLGYSTPVSSPEPIKIRLTRKLSVLSL